MKRTKKQCVLDEYPDAFLWMPEVNKGCKQIYLILSTPTTYSSKPPLGRGYTEQEAWNNAYNHLFKYD